MLVLGYADWCGHCKKFMPVWNQFKDKYMPILDIREVNADEEKDKLEALGIRGFPTVLFLDGKKKHSYEGPRTVEGLENFVRSKANRHLRDNLSDYTKK